MSFVRPGRAIHVATADGGLSEKVLFSRAAPDAYRKVLLLRGLLSCDPCLVANAERLREQTYTTVYENKIERNSPMQCYCCAFDRVDVLYMDRAEFGAISRAGCCTPLCTHCRFCPTCLDACGEGLVLHGDTACSRHQSCTHGVTCAPLCAPCCNYKMLYPLHDAEELRIIIMAARSKALTAAAEFTGNTSSFTPHARVSLTHLSPSSTPQGKQGLREQPPQRRPTPPSARDPEAERQQGKAAEPAPMPKPAPEERRRSFLRDFADLMESTFASEDAATTANRASLRNPTVAMAAVAPDAQQQQQQQQEQQRQEQRRSARSDLGGWFPYPLFHEDMRR